MQPFEGYAKLRGQDIEFYIQKLSVTLGRTRIPDPSTIDPKSWEEEQEENGDSTSEINPSSNAQPSIETLQRVLWEQEVDIPLGTFKNISRLHAKIVFNTTTKNFELHVISKNGAKVNGVYYPPLPFSQPIPLHNGYEIQLGDCLLTFLLPIKRVSRLEMVQMVNLKKSAEMQQEENSKKGYSNSEDSNRNHSDDVMADETNQPSDTMQCKENAMDESKSNQEMGSFFLNEGHKDVFFRHPGNGLAGGTPSLSSQTVLTPEQANNLASSLTSTIGPSLTAAVTQTLSGIYLENHSDFVKSFLVKTNTSSPHTNMVLDYLYNQSLDDETNDCPEAVSMLARLMIDLDTNLNHYAMGSIVINSNNPLPNPKNTKSILHTVLNAALASEQQELAMILYKARKDNEQQIKNSISSILAELNDKQKKERLELEQTKPQYVTPIDFTTVVEPTQMLPPSPKVATPAVEKSVVNTEAVETIPLDSVIPTTVPQVIPMDISIEPPVKQKKKKKKSSSTKDEVKKVSEGIKETSTVEVKKEEKKKKKTVKEEIVKAADVIETEIMPSEPKTEEKPDVSYATMIAKALIGAPNQMLQLKSIYAWICENYPYFEMKDSGWKSSVRHNLSTNTKHFRRVDPEEWKTLTGQTSQPKKKKEKKLGEKPKKPAFSVYALIMETSGELLSPGQDTKIRKKKRSSISSVTTPTMPIISWSDERSHNLPPQSSMVSKPPETPISEASAPTLTFAMNNQPTAPISDGQITPKEEKKKKKKEKPSSPTSNKKRKRKKETVPSISAVEKTKVEMVSDLLNFDEIVPPKETSTAEPPTKKKKPSKKSSKSAAEQQSSTAPQISQPIAQQSISTTPIIVPQNLPQSKPQVSQNLLQNVQTASQITLPQNLTQTVSTSNLMSELGFSNLPTSQGQANTVPDENKSLLQMLMGNDNLSTTSNTPLGTQTQHLNRSFMEQQIQPQSTENSVEQILSMLQAVTANATQQRPSNVGMPVVSGMSLPQQGMMSQQAFAEFARRNFVRMPPGVQAVHSRNPSPFNQQLSSTYIQQHPIQFTNQPAVNTFPTFVLQQPQPTLLQLDPNSLLQTNPTNNPSTNNK